MAIPQKFANKAATSSTQTAATVAQPARTNAPKARYGGIQETRKKEDILGWGRYQLELLDFVEGLSNPHKGTKTNRMRVRVVEAAGLDAQDYPRGLAPVEPGVVGQTYLLFFRVEGPGYDKGREQMRDAVQGFCGFDDPAEYQAFDPKGFAIDHFLGFAVPQEVDGEEVAKRYEGLSIIGRKAYTIQKPGMPMLDKVTKEKTGNYWTEALWGAAEEPIG